MKFENQLQEGRLLKRYKRFFADIEWKGQVITAHLPNTGSLKTALYPNQACLFSESQDPKRKLKYTLQMVQTPEQVWVGVNTSMPNLLIKEKLQSLIVGPELHMKDHPFTRWSEFDEIKPEYKISAETRLDFGLRKKSSEHWHFIEVKNVTLCDSHRTAQFPDAVTERGQKHLRELMSLMDLGHTAEIVFTIQRGDAQTFSAAKEIDPTYAALLQQAQKRGVHITPLLIHVTPQNLEVGSEVLTYLP